jgi:hypothetical protein
MAISISKLFAPVQLGTAVAEFFLMPATPTTSVIKNGRLRLTNTSAAAASVTLYAVPSGSAPAAGNECLPAISIAANQNLDVDFPTLAAGDSLQGLASAANAITVHELGGIVYS